MGTDRQAFNISQTVISNYKLYCVTKTMLCTCGAPWLHTVSVPRVNEIIFLLGGYATDKSTSKGSLCTSSTSHRAGPWNKTLPNCSLQLNNCSQERLFLSLTVTARKWDVLFEHEQLQDLCAYSRGCLCPLNMSLVGGLSQFWFWLFLPPPLSLKVPSLLLLL